MELEPLKDWIKGLKRKPETRREWLQRAIMVAGVLLLGVVGYKKEEAEGLLRNGKHRLSALLKKAHHTSPAAKNVDPVVSYEPIPQESEYRAFLETLQLRYIGAEEIIRPHRNYRNGVGNTIPPKSLWVNIIPTLRLADKMRTDLGARVTVLSIYRSPDYNSAINGASRSQHMRNIAIDLKFACSSDEAFAYAKTLRDNGEFSGGIGWYPSFIHVDTRGYDATWGKV